MDENRLYNAWLEGGKKHEALQKFLCFNSHFWGEEGDLDLNFCGKQARGTHDEKMKIYSSTDGENPQFQKDEL